MIFIILFLTISLIAFGKVLVSYLVLKRGRSVPAVVRSVEYTVATGLHSFLTAASRKKEGESMEIRCDYILKVAFQDPSGQEQEASLSVPAVMKIIDGKRTPYFKEGDTLTVRCRERFPSAVCIDDPEVNTKQKYIPKLILWAVCTILSAAILITALKIPPI